MNYSKFVFESNIPATLDVQMEKSFTGFAKFTSLDEDNNIFKVEFINGKKYINGRLITNVENNSSNLVETEMPVIESPLLKCIKKIMRAMSIGEWVIFLATEPESMAGLILACAIDVYILN